MKFPEIINRLSIPVAQIGASKALTLLHRDAPLEYPLAIRIPVNLCCKKG